MPKTTTVAIHTQGLRAKSETKAVSAFSLLIRNPSAMVGAA
ncbi:hypothetical protein [Leucobacter komagatae]|nr:hypothetical protein [Leucobacter komagatae]